MVQSVVHCCRQINVGIKVILIIFFWMYVGDLTLRLLISYIYGAPSKARNANVVYIWTYVWQR